MYAVQIGWACDRCRASCTPPAEALEGMSVVRSLTCDGVVRVHVDMSPWACPACGHALGRLVIREGALGEGLSGGDHVGQSAQPHVG